ncbi:RNA methyltransferase [Flavobacteriaceae bacterium]|jgi:tRNA G18 (ribose-2'-O)-methylase SpoU|nr:RNA methyltransferase [Flavobacteriaceae bacterium]MDB2340350.1 RNA methyltransferase [Flavobacteriaceae bacterium]MDC0875235.1 RNA methyltransferase [Flavobacteriaceae bacterium]
MRKLKNEELIRKTVSDFKQAEKTPLILILDNIRSLNNIGSVFRTADAFLIEKIYLCGITATPPHKDIHKTALGATENVAWEYVENTLDVVQKLQNEKVSVWAIEQTEKAVLLDVFQPKKNTKHAFILGNEVRGVAQEVVNACGQALEIPQFGTKHSLNISVATGVVVWDYFTKK